MGASIVCALKLPTPVLDRLRIAGEERDFEVQESATHQDVLNLASESLPTCVVVGGSLLGDRDLDLLRSFEELDNPPATLFLIRRANADTIVEAFKLGIYDIVTEADEHELGDRVAKAVEHAARQRDARRSAGSTPLTPRECDVLEHLLNGLTGKEVAERLGIGYRTMEKHRASLMRKLDAESLSKLVEKIVEHRVTEIGDPASEG